MADRACFHPEDRYKPAFAFKTPDGFWDEQYLIPFTFTVPGDGSPSFRNMIQMPDDAPWILRGIILPQIGISSGFMDSGRTPGAARLWDGRGNPMSKGLVLTLGAWCQSGYGGVNAFGYWFADEVIFEPGGNSMLDLQLNTNAGIAIANLIFGVDSIIFLANVYGTAGNGTTVNLIDPAAANSPLSISVGPGLVIDINLETDGAAAIVTTSQEVIDIINETPAALALVMAWLAAGTGLEVVTADVAVLAGGTAGTDITVNGCLLGVKRRPIC
jgi:hypothetical protein